MASPGYLPPSDCQQAGPTRNRSGNVGLARGPVYRGARLLPRTVRRAGRANPFTPATGMQLHFRFQVFSIVQDSMILNPRRPPAVTSRCSGNAERAES